MKRFISKILVFVLAISVLVTPEYISAMESEDTREDDQCDDDTNVQSNSHVACPADSKAGKKRDELKSGKAVTSTTTTKKSVKDPGTTSGSNPRVHY